MRGASQARVETVNRADDFQGAFGIGEPRSQKGTFVGAVLPRTVSGRSVPSRGDDRLPVGDAALFDDAVVREGAARCFAESHTAGGFGPRLRIPFFHVRGGFIPGFDVGDEVVGVFHHQAGRETAFECPGGVPSQSGKEGVKGKVHLL